MTSTVQFYRKEYRVTRPDYFVDYHYTFEDVLGAQTCVFLKVTPRSDALIKSACVNSDQSLEINGKDIHLALDGLADQCLALEHPTQQNGPWVYGNKMEFI